MDTVSLMKSLFGKSIFSAKKRERQSEGEPTTAQLRSNESSGGDLIHLHGV
jgi:hypothetical protein